MPETLQLIHPRNLKHLSGTLHRLIKSQLWVQVLLGMFLGFGVGLVLSPSVGIVDPDISEIIAAWLVLPGNVFLTIIQMIVIPLVLASVVRGIAATGTTEQLRSTGLRLVIYFLFTTTIAISIGISASWLLSPGSYIDDSAFTLSESATTDIEDEISSGSEIDLVALPKAMVSVLPENPFTAAAEMQMLQIVLFSIIFGLALVSLKPKNAKPLLEFMGSLQSVVMRVVSWVMYLAPYAVFGFIAQVTMQTGFEALLGIGFYTLTVLLGLLALIIFYLVIAFVLGGDAQVGAHPAAGRTRYGVVAGIQTVLELGEQLRHVGGYV